MIICVTPEDLARDRTPKYNGRVTEMFGDRAVPWDGPCGHLVRQRHKDSNPPHFHEADQYQIFVAGEARVGGHQVKAGSVHYSDGYSGYGPIEAGPDGCTYLTLRPVFDTSNHPLPQDAKLARGRKGQQQVAEMDLGDGAREGVATLFQRPDGVGVYQQDAAPGAALPEVPTTGGSYWLVMKGEVAVDGRPCPEGTCLWVGEGETRPAMTAGAEGATVAVMCFAARQSAAARGAKAGLAA